MRIKEKRERCKEVAVLEITNIILAIVAFSFIVGLSSVKIVSGAIVWGMDGDPSLGYDAATKTLYQKDVYGNIISQKQLGGAAGGAGLGTTPIVAKTAIGGIAKVGEAIPAGKWVTDGGVQLVDAAGKPIEGALYPASPGNSIFVTKEGTEMVLTQNGAEIGRGASAVIGGTESATVSSGINTPLGNLGSVGGLAGDALIQGAIWALAAYGIGQLIGSLLGLSPGLTNAISLGAAAGVMAGHIAYGFIPEAGQGLFAPGGFGFGGTSGILGLGPVGVGIAVAVIVFIMTYSETKEKLVTFECQPWEAPTGGANCEKCNNDLYPCSEYRCRSLGQACQLLNVGTNEEKCAWVNPKDVNSPIIQTDDKVLTPDHKYNPNTAIRPPDRGVKIQYTKSSDGCVKAFTPLTFGILVNEPAQCKIDYNRTSSYDNMAYYFGGSNIYKYNHTQTLSLPGPDAINAEAPELKADGTYNLYVRCKDANNNTNDDMFVFSFCVEKGPDVTAPVITGTSIANNMPFQYGLNSTALEVYVNEPAQCKWSKTDQSYDNMETQMTCSQHVYDMNSQMLYKCTTTLTGLLDRQDNIFYFKCRDQPVLGNSSDRNTNTESYKFTLKGTQLLNIKQGSVKPNETVKGAGTLATLYLELETENGNNYGDAWCSYSTTGLEKDYIQMFETGTNKHKQRLDLSSGEYIYYFQCVDLGGNSAWTNTSFKVEIDNNPPVIVRVFKEGDKLKVITDEKSNCAYSNSDDKKCNFAIAEGTNMPYVNSTEHYSEWTTKNYYIKCEDSGGRQPNPTDCSIIVKPQS